MQLYLDDLQTEQSWSDREECRLFVENVLTAFGSADTGADEESSDEQAAGTRLPQRSLLDAVAALTGAATATVAAGSPVPQRAARSLSDAGYLSLCEKIPYCAD